MFRGFWIEGQIKGEKVEGGQYVAGEEPFSFFSSDYKRRIILTDGI